MKTVKLLIVSTVAMLGASGSVFAQQDQPAMAQKIIAWTNNNRQAQGLPPLRVDNRLMQAARTHAFNMARTGIKDHVINNQNPHDRVKQTGYPIKFVSENIGWVPVNNPNPAGEMMKWWMNSANHRANILAKNSTDIGVGVFLDQRTNTHYLCQVFGTPSGPQTIPGQPLRMQTPGRNYLERSPANPGNRVPGRYIRRRDR